MDNPMTAQEMKDAESKRKLSESNASQSQLQSQPVEPVAEPSAFKFATGEITNRGEVVGRRLEIDRTRIYQCLKDDMYSWWNEKGLERIGGSSEE